ncbi:hypothetical protein AB0N14_15615 [Streptomyces sp. NPDC051104]|uniref:hypothetical protein n=1 Tax=Streptomyces sp. NPDC051104 TaxID=3155044 RepID=UPI003420FEA4
MPSAARKYGRRAPKGTPAISFSRIFTGKVPVRPSAADHLARLNGGRQMLGSPTSPGGP